MVGVEKAQTLRHVVDRGVELEIADTQRLFLFLAPLVFMLEPRVELFAFGNVLVGRDPAAIGQRANGVGDDPAVGEFLYRGVERDVAADALTDVVLMSTAHLETQIQPVLDQRTGRRPRPHLVG